MKYKLTFTLLILGLMTTLSANAQPDSTMLLGQVTKQYIEQSPHKTWFTEGYNNYKIGNISSIQTNNIKIKILFGSWCGDSRRELPRFIKTLHELGFSENQYQLIAVNRSLDMYKQSPDGEHKGMQVYRVPSFLIYENDSLLNRITESPKETLEKDLAKILKRESYEPHYSFSLDLDKNLAKNKRYLRKIKDYDKHRDELVSPSELTAYALSKYAAEEYWKSLEALKFNLAVFPNYNRNLKFLGIVYHALGKDRSARKHLKKYLEFKPEDKYSQHLLALLQD